MKTNYARSNDVDIASIIEQGNKILYRKEKKVNGEKQYEWIEYSVHKKPVYMQHSHNWTFRVMMLTGKFKDLIEYLYLNDLTLQDFKFPERKIYQHEMKKRMDNF